MAAPPRGRPALLAIAVLIGGGVYAAVKVSQERGQEKPANPRRGTRHRGAHTGPFTGTYTANF